MSIYCELKLMVKYIIMT